MAIIGQKVSTTKSFDVLQPIMPALLGALEDPDPWVSQRAMVVLGCLGQQARGAKPALLRIVRSQNFNSDWRAQAVGALSRIGPGDPETVRALIVALGDPYNSVRSIAISALGQFGAAAREAEASLRRMLNSGSPLDRRDAAEALRRIHPDKDNK